MHPEWAETVQAELAEVGDEQVEQDLVGEWQGATMTMRATTFGSSRVNQAGRDLYVGIGE